MYTSSLLDIQWSWFPLVELSLVREVFANPNHVSQKQFLPVGFEQL